MPGRAWNDPLICTSYGSVKPADALKSVWNGGTWLQYAYVVAPVGVFGFELARSKQLLVAVRSVVAPPKMNPRGSRAFTLISNPLYTWVFLVDHVVMLLLATT